MDLIVNSSVPPVPGANPKPPSPNPVLIQGIPNRRDQCGCVSKKRPSRKGSKVRKDDPSVLQSHFQGSGRLLNRAQASVRAKEKFRLPRVPNLQFYNYIPGKAQIRPIRIHKDTKVTQGQLLAAPTWASEAKAELEVQGAPGFSPLSPTPAKTTPNNSSNPPRIGSVPAFINPQAGQSAATEPNQPDGGLFPPLARPVVRQSAACEPNHSDAWSLLSLIDFDAGQSAAAEPNQPDAESLPSLPGSVVRQSAAGEPNHSDAWSLPSLIDFDTGQSAADEPNQPDSRSFPVLSESVARQSAASVPNHSGTGSSPFLAKQIVLQSAANEPNPWDEWPAPLDFCTDLIAVDERNQPHPGLVPPLPDPVVTPGRAAALHLPDTLAVPPLSHPVRRINTTETRPPQKPACPLSKPRAPPSSASNPNQLKGDSPATTSRTLQEVPKKRRTRRAGRRIQCRRHLISYYTTGAPPRIPFPREITASRATEPAEEAISGQAIKPEQRTQRPLPKVVKVETIRGLHIARWKRPHKLSLAPTSGAPDIPQIPGDPRYQVYKRQGLSN